MKLASFKIDGRPTWGTVTGDKVLDLGAVLGERYPDLFALIEAGAYNALADAATIAQAYDIEGLTWLPVVTRPKKIFCIGHNYEAHRQETGRAKVGHPSIFLRFADTLTAHNAPIIRPYQSTSLDYEAELALIIGKGGRHIPEAEALAHVAGYACANDASVRDWQWHTQQFTPGKNFPDTAPLGPWMVTPDEIGNLDDITVTSRLNGTVMQHATLKDLIFSLPELIAYISAFTPISAGDIILTGTPGGVGAKRQPPVWMKEGDRIEVEIGQVGLLTNVIAVEPVPLGWQADVEEASHA